MLTDSARKGFMMSRVQRINTRTTNLDMMFNIGKNAPLISLWTSPIIFMTRSDEFRFRKNSYSCIRYCFNNLLDKATHWFCEYLISSQLPSAEKRLKMIIKNKDATPSIMRN